MNELEKLCRQAYGAYEYLRDHDLSAESGTSKRLRSGDLAQLRTRLAEELAELRGVVDGSHSHEGFEKDIVLEGYEVWYWAASLMTAQGFSYAQTQPHLSFEAGFKHPAASREELRNFALSLGKQIGEEPTTKEVAIGVFNWALYFVGKACALNQTAPARLLERDVAEMRQKTYLADYWQQVNVAI